MAEENKTPAKKAQPGKAAKILNWFRTLPQRIAKPFRNMYYELKKVTWPSKQRLITYSIIVLVFMLFMSIVIGLLDLGASTGVRALINGTASTAVTETAQDAAQTAEEAAAGAETAADNAAQAVTETAETAAAGAETAVDNAAETVTDAAETAVNAAEGTQETAEKTAEDASEGK